MKQNPPGGTVPTSTELPAAATMFALLEAAHLLEARLEAALGIHGLSLAKHGLLTQLAEASGPLTLTELAEGQKCVRSNITQLVDRLEADGLVKRVADPADRRSVRASLTEEGKALQRSGAAVLDQFQRDVAGAVEDKDRPALQRVLTALR